MTDDPEGPPPSPPLRKEGGERTAGAEEAPPPAMPGGMIGEGEPRREGDRTGGMGGEG